MSRFGIKTPSMELALVLANLRYQQNFEAVGRNLTQLWLENLGLDEIVPI